MDVHVELGAGVPENSYVMIQTGQARKLVRYDPCKPISIAGRHRLCRVEILQRVGYCDISVDPDALDEQEVVLKASDDSAGGAVGGLKWSSTPASGEPVQKTADLKTRHAELKRPLTAYLDSQNVGAMLSNAVSHLLQKKPDNAHDFLINYFGRLDSGKANGEASPISQVAQQIVQSVPEPTADMLVINGFFMGMRDCYTRAGARIHYYEVEWDPKHLSWHDFRSKVLGATDPNSAEPGSLRATINNNWRNLGMLSAPTIRDNGVHASASPLEAMRERANWLEASIEDDNFGRALAAAGVPFDTQREWLDDPQVEWHRSQSSLFDLLEDLDAGTCLEKAARLAGLASPGAEGLCTKNRAFVFVKPHAMFACCEGRVEALAREKLQAAGLAIICEGELEAREIDQKNLVDMHYGAIARKAVLLKPSETNPTENAQEQFGLKFGVSWVEALKSGIVFNALDACKELGIDGDAMSELWSKAKDTGNLLKFGGGFYCARIEVAPAPVQSTPIYTINGFFMEMRDCYTRPGAAIHYFDVEWDREEVSWADFRRLVLGATDPATAAPGSLRCLIKERWEALGLPGPPTIRDNGVHGSASPFEALCERANWMGTDLEADPLAVLLAAAGIPAATQQEWVSDPQVSFEGRAASLFDTLEDLDTWPLLGRAARVLGAGPVPGELRASCPKNRVFIFIKPHAMVANSAVQALVRETLTSKGFSILSEGTIGHEAIEEKKLIDKHYGAIAAKAALLKPAETNPSSEARERFGMTFQVPWGDALASGQVLNAVDTCKEFGICGEDLAVLWSDAKATGKLVKFGGGFYCARVR